MALIMKARAHVFVLGRVQGVFFRENTRIKAQELGITGWVKNLEDGRVEVVIEGEKEKVEKLVEWLHQGPSLARVEDLEIKWEDYRGEFNSFEIKL